MYHIHSLVPSFALASLPHSSHLRLSLCPIFISYSMTQPPSMREIELTVSDGIHSSNPPVVIQSVDLIIVVFVT